jgi:hypothetical protein
MSWARVACLLFFFYALAADSITFKSSRPPQVDQFVFERSGSGLCTLLFKRKIHQFRLLTSLDDVFVQTLPSHRSYGELGSETSLVLAYGYTHDAINDELNKHCTAVYDDKGVDARTLEFVVQEDSFYPPRDSSSIPLPPMFPAPPEMEVTSLFNSGSPWNRVDLVFFGDGCKNHFVILLIL